MNVVTAGRLAELYAVPFTMIETALRELAPRLVMNHQPFYDEGEATRIVLGLADRPAADREERPEAGQ